MFQISASENWAYGTLWRQFYQSQLINCPQLFTYTAESGKCQYSTYLLCSFLFLIKIYCQPANNRQYVSYSLDLLYLIHCRVYHLTLRKPKKLFKPLNRPCWWTLNFWKLKLKFSNLFWYKTQCKVSLKPNKRFINFTLNVKT